MNVKSHEVRTISEFTNFVETHEQGVTLLFRGQQQSHPLLPHIARFKANPNLGGLGDPNLSDVLIAERRMIEDFKKLSIPLLANPPDNNWDWLALAQHHGLPTRLLDWSKSGLTSLWFAVKDAAVIINGAPQDGVVWIFKPARHDYLGRDMYQGHDPFEADRISVIRPNHFAERITAQSALFTIHPSQLSTPHFKPFEDEERYEGSLNKLTIPSTCFHSIRFNLNRMGVNHFSLFPDLDGLSRFLYWTRSLDSDSPYQTKLPAKEQWVDEL